MDKAGFFDRLICVGDFGEKMSARISVAGSTSMMVFARMIVVVHHLQAAKRRPGCAGKVGYLVIKRLENQRKLLAWPYVGVGLIFSC